MLQVILLRRHFIGPLGLVIGCEVLFVSLFCGQEVGRIWRRLVDLVLVIILVETADAFPYPGLFDDFFVVVGHLKS